MIIADPHITSSGHDESCNADPFKQFWLPIKVSWEDPEDAGDDELYASIQEEVRTLRALSQTCRSLRAFTLPLLWSVVHVEELDELARLRETFRVSPHLARHVHCFCFSWPTGLLPYTYDHLLEDAGTFLDLELQAASSRAGSSGEQSLISSPEEFNECIIEVVAQMASLISFGWATFASPMPTGVFEALKVLPALTALHLNMEWCRCAVHTSELVVQMRVP